MKYSLKIKQFIRLFLPPIRIKLFRGPDKKPITFEGIFCEFGEVLEKYQNSTNYNSNQSLIDLEVEAIQELSNLEASLPPNLSYNLIRRNVLTFIVSMISGNNISLLDIGGGLGTTYLDLKYSSPNKIIDFTILELPDTAKIGSKIFRKHSNVKFITDFPSDKMNEFKIVHFGSSLQYFNDYKKVLKSCALLKPELIVLSGTAAGKALTFVCAQVNMENKTIPMWVFNLDEIVDFMEALGYFIIHKSISYYAFHNFLNYSGEDEANTQIYNLIFKQNNK